MNLQDQVIYRCIHAACARQLPRQVNFCPWCGTGQHDQVVNPAHVARPAQAEYQAAPDPVATPAPTPAPAPKQRSAYPPEMLAAAAAAPAAAPAAADAVPQPYSGLAAGGGTAPVLSGAPIVMQLPEAATPLRSQPQAGAAAPAAPNAPTAPVAPARPKAATPAGPPKREPVRLRWWLVALAALTLIWLYARPDSARKIAERIEAAKTAGAECRLNDAQSELIALRMTKATPAQLRQLQATIDVSSLMCGKKMTRETSWRETETSVESALAAGDFGKAQTQLAKFTKRWNEDAATRKLKARISERRAAAAPVAAVPLPEVVERSRPVSNSSARNLIDEAERALRAGDYRAAVDKLETCITMVEGGARECAAYKVHADRLLRDRERCTTAGRIWVGDQCS